MCPSPARDAGGVLEQSIAERGCQMVGGLQDLAREKGHFHNVRGAGSLIAFTMESADARDKLLHGLRDRGLLALPSGEQAIRFRMPLVVTEQEVDQALERIASSLPSGVQA